MTRAALGMFSLGCFVGGALALGFSTITDANYMTKIGFVIGAACTGPVFTLISYFGGQKTIGDGLYAYPIGLLLALMWWYAGKATENIQSDKLSFELLGWGHIAALVLISILVGVIYLWPVLFEAVWQRKPPQAQG